MRTNRFRSAVILCSLSTLVLGACRSSTGGEPLVKTDSFTRNTLSLYTIYNTPEAWSMGDGYLVASTAARQSVVIRNRETLTDGWVETETDQAADGGLVLRFQSAGNYYLMAVRDDSHFGYANVEIYRAAGGEFMRIGGPKDVVFNPGVRNTFRFEASGTLLTGYVNGKPAVQATDVAYTSGGFGLRHDNSREWPEVTSRFDLLRWGRD